MKDLHGTEGKGIPSLPEGGDIEKKEKKLHSRREKKKAWGRGRGHQGKKKKKRAFPLAEPVPARKGC